MSAPKYDEDFSSPAAVLHNVLENFKNLPASSHTSNNSIFGGSSNKGRLFGRQTPVHDLLGGGHSADVLLWRKKHLSAGFLVGTTAIWVLFEWIGYHFIAIVSFIVLVAVTTLFMWSNAAAFLNRAPPPVPKLELSEEVVFNVVRTVVAEINKMLAILHEIAIGRDIKRFAQVDGILFLLFLFGGWFHFLTLMYLFIVAAHTFPVLYEKNQDSVDSFVEKAINEFDHHYRKFDASFLSKIPRGPSVQKKTE